ncbi:MAG: hypothetical protein RLZZ507_3 [Cyanobacteriota bacterium]|jgi:predicted nucleic acid-binding protein
MAYLLDTNACIQILNSQNSPVNKVSQANLQTYVII